MVMVSLRSSALSKDATADRGTCTVAGTTFSSSAASIITGRGRGPGVAFGKARQVFGMSRVGEFGEVERALW